MPSVLFACLAAALAVGFASAACSSPPTCAAKATCSFSVTAAGGAQTACSVPDTAVACCDMMQVYMLCETTYTSPQAKNACTQQHFPQVFRELIFAGDFPPNNCFSGLQPPDIAGVYCQTKREGRMEALEDADLTALAEAINVTDAMAVLAGSRTARESSGLLFAEPPRETQAPALWAVALLAFVAGGALTGLAVLQCRAWPSPDDFHHMVV